MWQWKANTGFCCGRNPDSCLVPLFTVPIPQVFSQSIMKGPPSCLYPCYHGEGKMRDNFLWRRFRGHITHSIDHKSALCLNLASRKFEKKKKKKNYRLYSRKLCAWLKTRVLILKKEMRGKTELEGSPRWGLWDLIKACGHRRGAGMRFRVLPGKECTQSCSTDRFSAVTLLPFTSVLL